MNAILGFPVDNFSEIKRIQPRKKTKTMRKPSWKSLLLALFIALALVVSPTTILADTLKVVVKNTPPFVILDDAGKVKGGYSIELWDEIARQQGWTDIQYTVVATPKEMVDALQSGAADVGVGALSITSDRLKVIDFSHPFYDSGLDIMVSGGGAPSFLDLMERLFSPELLMVFGGIVIALIVISHVLWLLERHHNPKQFPHSYWEGLNESIWWTTCVLIGGSCMGKDPEGIPGRIVGTLWALVGISMIALLTATASSIMTADRLDNPIKGPKDLMGKKVATLAKSSAERYLTEHHVTVVECKDIDEASDKLLKGEVAAVVYDSPILLYYVANHDSTKLHLINKLFQLQKYGFGLQPNSKYRTQINSTIVSIQEGDFLTDLKKKYFAPSDSDQE